MISPDDLPAWRDNQSPTWKLREVIADHPTGRGHPHLPEVVSAVCELYEEQDLPPSKIGRLLGLTRCQVKGLLWRNGCVGDLGAAGSAGPRRVG